MRMCATCAWGPQRSEEDMRAPRTGVTMCVLETEPGLSAGAASALNCWPMSPVPVSPVCLVIVYAHCFFTSALPYNDQNKAPHCPGSQCVACPQATSADLSTQWACAVHLSSVVLVEVEVWGATVL